MTPRHAAFLRWGLSAVGLALLSLRLVPSGSMALRALHGRTAAAVEAAARAQALVAAEPLIHDSLQRALAEVVRLAPLLVEGGTRAEAAAALAGFLSARCAQLGLRVRSVESLPDSSSGPIATVLVHAALEGDAAGVASFLSSVEDGTPLLTILRLRIAAVDPTAPRSTPELLRLDLSISGLFLVRDAE